MSTATDRRGFLLGAWALAGGAAAADATPPEVAAEIAGARLVGQGRMRYLGIAVYDARLWAAARPTPADWTARPLALELQYARRLNGRLIAERSLDEMRRQGEIAAAAAARWLAAMSTAFPDVVAGDRLTGIQRPREAARFHLNGVLRAEVRDADFARLFFGIWLAEQTSEPTLRGALLGLAG